MANIQKRTTKDGKTTYRIRVFAGEAQDGKKILKSMTYCPADGMTARQIEKAVQKAAMEFERQVQQGGLVADSMTVDELFEKWFKEYAEPQLKPHTVSDYRKLVPRISAAHLCRFGTYQAKQTAARPYYAVLRPATKVWYPLGWQIQGESCLYRLISKGEAQGPCAGCRHRRKHRNADMGRGAHQPANGPKTCTGRRGAVLQSIHKRFER